MIEVFQVTLPNDQDAESFVTFIREEYFPDVFKGISRGGQFTDLVMLQGRNTIQGEDLDHEFFWHIGHTHGGVSALPVDDEEVTRKFESFKADVKRIGAYSEVAAWHGGHLAET